MQLTADKFDSESRPPAVEPIFVAAAVLVVAVLLIVALLIAAS